MSKIKWLDHHQQGNDHWRSKAEAIENGIVDCIIVTHGEVIHEDDGLVIISREARQDPDQVAPLYRDCHTIYKKMILERE